MRRIILSLLLSISIINLASNSQAKSAGKSGATFLKIGIGAKPTSMGEAFTAVADELATIYWNPAGLIHVKQRQASFTHISWFEKINYEYLAYAQPLQELGIKIPGVLATSLAYLGINDIKEYGPTKDSYLGTFKTHDLLLNFSYARLIKPDIFSGLNLKFINQKIKSSSSGLAMDIGMLYKTPIKNLTGGLTLQNIALVDNFKDDLPFNIKLGSSYKLLKDDILTLAMDIDIPSDTDIKLHLGAEYLYPEIEDIEIAIRLGFKTGVDCGKLGFGFGVKFDRYKFDYAYSSYNDLGNIHQLSFDIKFDKIKPQPTTSKIKETLQVPSHSTSSDSKPDVDFESEGENVTENTTIEKASTTQNSHSKNEVEKQIVPPVVEEREEVKETSMSFGDTNDNENVIARSKATLQASEIAKPLAHNDSDRKKLFSEEIEVVEEIEKEEEKYDEQQHIIISEEIKQNTTEQKTDPKTEETETKNLEEEVLKQNITEQKTKETETKNLEEEEILNYLKNNYSKAKVTIGGIK